MCKACPYGYSTACVGCGVTQGDCGVRAGFGLAADGVVRECAIGTYNNVSIGGDCTSCTTGTTTPFSGADTPQMCNLCLPGFGGTGADDSGCTTVCGNGTVSSPAGCRWRSWRLTGLGCLACLLGTNHALPADPLCLPCSRPSQYGVAGRGTGSVCANCSTQETGYSFSWQLKNDIYPVNAISRDYASTSIDCVSEFAQIQDGAW